MHPHIVVRAVILALGSLKQDFRFEDVQGQARWQSEVLYQKEPPQLK